MNSIRIATNKNSKFIYNVPKQRYTIQLIVKDNKFSGTIGSEGRVVGDLLIHTDDVNLKNAIVGDFAKRIKNKKENIAR